MPNGQWAWFDANIVLPRGFAKTTLVTKALVLWLICTEQLRFTVILSDVFEQAELILNDIGEQLRTNPRILAAYGSLLSRQETLTEPGQQGRRTKDTTAQLITTTGCCVKVAASGKKVRGWSYLNQRPQLIIGDDIEGQESVSTLYQRNKREKWWDGDVVPARDMTKARVLLVGNLIHGDSVLHRKVKQKTARTFFRKAILDQPTRTDLWDTWNALWTDQGEEAADAYYAAHAEEMEHGSAVLWPEGRPLHLLMRERRKIGPFTFQTEYQNDPVAEGVTIIQEPWLASRPTFHDGEDPFILDGAKRILLSALIKRVSTVDVAISKKDGADFFVITTGGKAADGTVYVWDVVRAHLSSPEQIRAIFQVNARWAPDRIRIETVQYQEALKEMVDDEAKRTGVHIATEGYKPDKDKVRRMMKFQPQFEQGVVKLCDTVPSSCVDELLSFPLGEHDDFVDTLPMLLDALLTQPRFAGITSL